MFCPLHHFLRSLVLAALFRVRVFLLHLSKRFCHVFALMQNFKAYVDRGTLPVAIAIQSLGRASISMIFFCFSSFSTMRTSLA